MADELVDRPAPPPDLRDQPYEVPRHERIVLAPRRHDHCVVVPVLNEGERIRNQLERMRDLTDVVDIVIADGGSTDGALEPELLAKLGVRALLVKRDAGRLGAQLRMAFGWALEEGYEGIVTIDGNGKDGVEAIPQVVAALDRGDDFVQGSRFVRGGHHEHTPTSRLLAIRLVHAPVSSLLARHWYTDTTNGFRGHSRRLLTDPRMAVFRTVFDRYELLVYLSVRAPRLGYRVEEIPVSRVYPAGEPVPTKIGKVRGSADLLGVLARQAIHRYDP
ncbi:MAG: glycosyltransferase family 2 protein [Acidimicrobiales bacterium]